MGVGVGVPDVCCDSVLRLPSPPLVPGPSAVTEHLKLDPVPASVGVARRFVRDLLDSHGDVDEDTLDTLLLLASELVTNAVRHAATPFEIRVAVDDDTVRVAVIDGDVDHGPRMCHPGPDDTNGRGLQLVDQLSAVWGSDRVGRGKAVWFQLA